MMERDEFVAALTQARKFGGFGLDPFFESFLAHDQAQRVVIEQLQARLEIDHAYKFDTQTNLTTRVDIPPEQRHKQIDGITARDATIHLLEEEIGQQRVVIQELTTQRDKLSTGLATSKAWKDDWELEVQEHHKSKAKIEQQAKIIAELESQNGFIGGTLYELHVLREKNSQQAKEIARLQAVNNDWQREFRGAVDSYNSLEQETKALREALQLLYDCQNGCPLPKYEADWNRAMQLSERALREVS